MMGAVRTSETSVDNHFTRQYIPEDNSEHHIIYWLNFMSDVFISIYSGAGGAAFIKLFKGGGASYKRLGTSALM
jgi:hypothetical protein